MKRIRTGRASRLGWRIRCVFCFAFYVVFCVVFCFHSLADSGERRKPHRTGHSGAREGQDKGFVLKLSWPSTAEYRMMKLKKKKNTDTFDMHTQTHRCRKDARPTGGRRRRRRGQRGFGVGIQGAPGSTRIFEGGSGKVVRLLSVTCHLSSVLHFFLHLLAVSEREASS